MPATSPSVASLRKRIAKLEEEKAQLERDLDVLRANCEKNQQNHEAEVASRILIESRHRTMAERYHMLIAQIPGVVFTCLNDAAWTMELISDKIEDLSGHPASDFIDNAVRTYASIIYKEDIMPVFINVNTALKQRTRYRIEYRIVHSDGTLRYVTEVGQGIYSVDGSLLRIAGIIFDITKRFLGIDDGIFVPLDPTTVLPPTEA